MKHFRLQIQRQKNNDPLFLFSLYTRPHLFSRVNYAACHSNHIKLRWFTSASWTNTRQVMQKFICAQTLHFVSPPSRRKNNEPAYREGNFTGLIQSQVPAFKSLVMQMTTSSFFSLWYATSGSIIANRLYIFYSTESRWISPLHILSSLHDDFCQVYRGN